MVQQNIRQSELFISEDWQAAFKAFKDINFQSYSFTSIKTAMIDYIKTVYPEDFNDYSQNSEFMFVVDLLAYLGEILAYRVELNSRNNFIDTAERRDSIIRLAKMLNYNLHRNIPAKGLVKITSISTTQQIFDSNNTDISNRLILWNDSSNPDWYEQFITIMNAAFVSTNQFGNPVKSLTINDIPTQLYKFNNLTGFNAVDAFSTSVSGQAMDFEIINCDINSQSYFTENTPNQNLQKHIIYRNDGAGNASKNSGFFMMFKQGTLRFEDYLFDLPIENRTVSIESSDINNTDVWVQQISETGDVISTWEKVLANENIVYTSYDREIRKIYSVLTDDNDTISLRFSDGRFGEVPVGNFRVWYRQSNGLSYTIRPNDIKNISLTIPYTKNSLMGESQTFTLTMTFSLQEAISNSEPTESLESAVQNAARVYYTQNRMTNGQDYNSLPLNYGQSVVRLKTLNRTYAGHSPYIDIKDPTKTYSSTIEFGDDGVLYVEKYDNKSTLTLPTNLSSIDILEQYIAPMLLDKDYKNFFYNSFTKFSLTGLFWGVVSESETTCTGFFVDGSSNPQQIGETVSGNYNYVRESSLVEFVNPSDSSDTIWASIVDLFGTGINFTSSGAGAVTLSRKIPNGWVANRTYIPFRNVILSSETPDIITQLENKTSFGIRYDTATSTWKVITTTNLSTSSNFSLTFAGDTTNTYKDSSWVIKCEYTSSGWSFTCKSLRYVFESILRSRFFISPETKAVNIEENKINYDTIKLLKYNTKPNSSDQLADDYDFTISKAIKYADGYVEPRRIQVILDENDVDGSIIDPDEFYKIVSSTNTSQNYIVQKKYTDSLGYEYYKTLTDSSVLKFNTNSELFAYNSWEDNKIAFVLESNTFFQYIDGAETNISFNVAGSSLTITQHGFQTGDRIVFFINSPPVSPSLPDPIATHIFYYVYVIDDNTIKLCLTENDVSLTSPIFVTITTNSVGVVSILKQTSKYKQYRAYLGRTGLNYSYEHFSAQDERIDPSITNVIDMYILTSQYYADVINWKNSSNINDISTFPVPPSSFDLEQQFSDLQNYKMMSDEIIFKPAKFKLLFGAGADTELKASFKVIKAMGSTTTDNEIKHRIISVINDYFDISKKRFDFGEVFYFTELAAYIHSQLSTYISSVVIVPLYGPNRFGDLFQVRCASDELFLSTASVSNIEIISAITSTNIRSGI